MYWDCITSLHKDRVQWCFIGLAALGFWRWVVGVGLLALGGCVWRVCISRFCVWRFCVGRFCVGLLLIGFWRLGFWLWFFGLGRFGVGRFGAVLLALGGVGFLALGFCLCFQLVALGCGVGPLPLSFWPPSFFWRASGFRFWGFWAESYMGSKAETICSFYDVIFGALVFWCFGAFHDVVNAIQYCNM